MRPSLVNPRLYNSEHRKASSREKPKIASIIIPTTPINTSLPFFDKDVAAVQKFGATSVTPPISIPSRPQTCSKPTPPTEADIDMNEATAAAEILAIAELFSTLKRTTSKLHTAFERLGKQAEKMALVAPAIKADEQIKHIRMILEKQIADHECSMHMIRKELEEAIKECFVQSLKTQIYGFIHEKIINEVQQRVQDELKIQIPEKLREQVQIHKREIIEVQTDLYNSDARRHNASLRSPIMSTEPLRPLLRPLPSALQSPAYVLKRPFTANPSLVGSPMSAFPGVPAPTPMTFHAPALMFPPGSNQMFEYVPPTPSPLFPRDLRSLFSLGPDATKRLLQDYGLSSTASATPSPNTEKPKAKAPPKTGLNTPDDSPTCEVCSASTHEEDINKFMAHIGVPFLMVPAPKLQTRNLTCVAIQERPPLIISTSTRAI